MIQLAIIHSQPIYCQGIALALKKYHDIKIIASAASLRELIAKEPTAVLDIILWHIPSHHAVPSGLKTVKKIYPLAKVLVLTDTTNNLYGGLLVNLGAAAVINPGSDLKQLYRSIVNLSQSYAPPPSSNHVQDPKPNTCHKYGISPRELDVLQLICQGLTDQRIGERLKISKRTVDGHRLNLRKKLKVNNTAMLVRVALEKNLLGSEKQSNISYDIL